MVSLNLTVLNPSSSITETSCGDYITPSGAVLTTSQIFTDVIPSFDGCDSTITIDLTVVEINDSVTINGASILTSNETNPNATFQWYQCVTPSLLLFPGATSQDFFADGIGFYAVVITLNGCTDTSACEFVTSIQNQLLSSDINIFPNPTNENFTIDLGEIYQDIQVEIYSIDGKMITNQSFKNQQQINAKIETISGLYQVKVTTEKGVVNKIILKE